MGLFSKGITKEELKEILKENVPKKEEPSLLIKYIDEIETLKLRIDAMETNISSLRGAFNRRGIKTPEDQKEEQINSSLAPKFL